MPELKGSGAPSKVSQARLRRPHRNSPLRRGLWLAAFLFISGALVYGIRRVLTTQGTVPIANVPEQIQGAPSPIPLESKDNPNKDGEGDRNRVLPLPVPEPEKPQIIQPPPDYPGGIEPKAPGIVALEVLEKFIAAKTLADRQPMMETQTPESELATSCLAAPLPAVRGILIDAQEANLVENVLDIYYNVDFDAGNNQINPQTILVRIRGTAEPKVVADPFLDMFGGRLAAYAKTPNENAGTFQVIVWAVASCTDERVRNREKKLTLKLLPRDNAKEIAQAYFGRQSRIGMMLEDGNYSLSYGKAKACTVVLRWNTEDNPEYPYLEAIDLKTMD